MTCRHYIGIGTDFLQCDVMEPHEQHSGVGMIDGLMNRWFWTANAPPVTEDDSEQS